MSDDGGILAAYAAPPAAAPKRKRKAAASSSDHGGILDAYGGGKSTVTAPAAEEPNLLQKAVGGAGMVLDRLGVPKVIDILDRPRQATQAAIAGHNGFDALLHGQTPEQQDANRAAVRARIPDLSNEYGANNQFERGLVDFALDTVTDPTTIVGGPLIKGALKGITGGVRAADTLATRVAPKTAAEIREYANAVGDKFTYGGSAKRNLGEQTFNHAIAAESRQASRQAEAERVLTERFNKHLAGLSDADKTAVYQVLNGERDTRGMPQHLVEAVNQGRALTRDMAALRATESGSRKLAYGGGNLANADVRFRMHGPAVQGPTVPPSIDDIIARAKAEFGENHEMGVGFKPNAKKPVRRIVGRVDRQYQLPDELRDFAAPAEQGTLGAENIRSNYLPAPIPERATDAAASRPSSYNLLLPKDMNALERDEFEVRPELLPGLDDAFRSAIKSAARQGTAGRLRDELGVIKGGNADPDLLRLFDRPIAPTFDQMNTGQKAVKRWQQLVNVPKTVVTAFGLKHGLVNVPALAGLSEGPGAAIEALINGARASAMKPGDRYKFLRQGVEGGVITPFEDRANPIVDWMSKLGAPGKIAAGAANKASNLTWAIDDAAKQAVFRRKVARGMNPDAAAAETMREMVDYRHPSEFTNAAKNVAPFATFRTKIPVAVASSIARDPKKVLAYDRATQGLATNGKVQVGTDPTTGKPIVFSVNTPLSDVMQIPGKPHADGERFDPSNVPGLEYARGSLADPLKLGLSIPAALAGMVKNDDGTTALSPSVLRMLRYFTHGQQLSPHFDENGKLKTGAALGALSNYLPLGLGDTATAVGGASEWTREGDKMPDLLDLLLGGTVGAHIR